MFRALFLIPFFFLQFSITLTFSVESYRKKLETLGATDISIVKCYSTFFPTALIIAKKSGLAAKSHDVNIYDNNVQKSNKKAEMSVVLPGGILGGGR